ncbi:hypothetical protein [uncultured Campylobacter sp.]|uniref:hypothetical protein n=1 Tax=uncultured Campylobacter sp. TaxID=218934 RepID=UPI002625BC4C|nr:hypothetical protein [uncultured Campylobacter sp.]
MNRKQRLEKLKKILNERRQNLEQGSQENSDAENFDSKNSKFEKITDDSTINTNEKPNKFEQNSSCASDYNKEPLVVKDRTNFYIVLATVCTLAIMIFMYSYEPNQTRYNQLFIVFPFFGLPIIMEYFTNFYNKKLVKFYNDRVTYYTNKMPEKTIFLDDLKDVQRAYFARDNEWLRRQGAFYRFLFKFEPYTTIIAFLLICILVLAIDVRKYIETGSFRVFFISILAFLFLFVLKFIYFLVFKFRLRLIFYDNIIIRGKDKDIAFTIETMDDYIRIKEFFMKTKGINLDKTQRHVWLDFN